MQSFKIEGGHKLKGEISPQGAKNEALQILCAVLLTDQKILITTIFNLLLNFTTLCLNLKSFMKIYIVN